ncbi:MAG TPA: NAD(P)H-dependent oxidoreductase [Caulobacteraceae bacterium]|jgi:chromate reductase
MPERKVAVVVGSLRKGSFNRKMALALEKLAPASLKLGIIEIRDLPLYDEDLETSPPQAWLDFRQAVRERDAVIFVTPEYNRGVPGGLKNAIDVGSRPYGQSVWSKKPVAVVSVSPGGIGGFGANHHLRQSLVFLDMPVLQQPEAYIGGAATLFAEDGSIANESTQRFATRLLEAFAAWIEKVLG